MAAKLLSRGYTNYSFRIVEYDLSCLKLYKDLKNNRKKEC